MYRASSYACFIGYYIKEQIRFLSGLEALFQATYDIICNLGISCKFAQLPFTTFQVLDILTTSVSAIEKGQEEGARALGYNSTQTFFHVVLPQALRIAFPQIKSELVSLIKETSIVGYISISDLTRVSDIVRGRTYEAFFPLISTTIIYFALIGLILFVVKRLKIEMTARSIRIKKIKNGINTKSHEK